MLPHARFALLLAPLTLHATCAIAVWTPTSLVLGADSMERVVNPNDPGREISECKVQQIGNYFVLVSGLTRHRRTGFDTWGILSSAIRQSGSVFEAADLAVTEIEKGYAAVLRSARLNTDAKFVHNLELNAPVFVIAGFEGGRPYLAHCSFDKILGRWTWTRQFFPSDRSGTPVAYTYLCEEHGVSMYKSRHPNWRRDNPVKVVQGMIRMEEQVLPEEVGGPVSLVVIDKNGAHWKNVGVCPAAR
jgi:hypothetical protein